jgi:ATP-binding cassette, subfamily B, bacterial PglK
VGKVARTLSSKKKSTPMMANLKMALTLLGREQRQRLALLLALMLLVALLETLGIGLLLPYISIVNSPELIEENRYLNAIYLAFEFDAKKNFVVAVSIALVVVFIIKNGVYVLQQYFQSRQLLSFQLSIETRLMKSYLQREYLFFVVNNSAELYQNIRNVSGIVGLVYTPALTIATELIVLLLIGGFLLFVQPWVTLSAVLVLAILAYSIYRFSRKRAVRYGEEGNRHLVEMNKWMYQSFGGIKEVKILSKEDFFLAKSMTYSRQAAWSGLKAGMLTAITRPIIETVWFGFTVLLVLVSILAGKSGSNMLPIIVLLAAAAIRIMPALNRILNSTIAIRQATPYVNAVVGELGRYLKDDAALIDGNCDSGAYLFKKSIRFSNIAFTYPGAPTQVLNDLSLAIKKGQSIAFVGPSGAGKTTAVDLLLGLLEPQRGEIVVDDRVLMGQDARSWRRNFGYVPQTIYLSDDSIRNNIAFGQLQTEIDSTRMDVVVAQAQLTDVLARLPEGLDTLVGDRGARLSGGQRQRIGIARALYRDPPILVLDEATSALDNETEREITRAIRDLRGSKTVILIAHRLSTVAHCDQIVFLVDGAVRASGTYDALIKDCEEFRRFATAGADLMGVDLPAS